MQWQDEGVLLNLRAHGEGHAVAEILTQAHGRHLGLVRGGLSRRMRPSLQSGNSFNVTWNARLESHLGNYTLDLATERAGGWLYSSSSLQALSTLTSHLHLLAEREPHPELYEPLLKLLDVIDDPKKSAAAVIQYELTLLQALGFGLDLERCAATGETENLTHVSPRTGRAVGQQAAAPYADRLFRLPDFLRSGEDMAIQPDIADGARLTGYFLLEHLYAPRGLFLPEARTSFFKTAKAA
ncbi:MAG: DNA repair protein RecO [Pseudomonadota bacterium]